MGNLGRLEGKRGEWQLHQYLGTSKRLIQSLFDFNVKKFVLPYKSSLR